jgi:hypothetical protein
LSYCDKTYGDHGLFEDVFHWLIRQYFSR